MLALVALASTTERRDVGPVDAWQVESVRVTAFRRAAPQKVVATAWEEIVGAPPEVVTSAPRERTHQAEGPYELGRLALQEQPDRGDVVYFAAADGPVDPSSGPFNVLGPCTEVVAKFAPLAKRWLGDLGVDLNRLAFGMVLRLPAGSREEGYEALGRFLHDIRIDPTGSSDFLYQINRWRPSQQQKEVAINRLSKWTVSRIVHTRLMAGGETLAASPIVELGHAVRAELDINTAATVDAKLDAKRAAAVLDEEIALALEIATKGDVP